MSSLRWDPRLIEPNRVIDLIGDWPAYVSYEVAELSQFEPEGGGPRQPDRAQANLRCGKCRQSMGLLGEGGAAVMTTPADLLAGVLRHAVMAHDVALSGAGRGSSDGRG